MRNHLLAALAVLATIALVTCGTPGTPEFIRTATISDMYEVEAGKIAAEKGKSDAVKQFGQRMVEAHSQTTEEVKGIVQQANNQGRSAGTARRQASADDRGFDRCAPGGFRQDLRQAAS
jgi:putative membrane protein